MAVVLLGIRLTLVSGIHRSCSAGSSAPLRRSAAPLLVHPVKRTPQLPPKSVATSPRQFWLPRLLLTWLPREELVRRDLASSWIAAGVPRWVTLIDEALFVLVSAMFYTAFCMHTPHAHSMHTRAIV